MSGIYRRLADQPSGQKVYQPNYASGFIAGGIFLAAVFTPYALPADITSTILTQSPFNPGIGEPWTVLDPSVRAQALASLTGGVACGVLAALHLAVAIRRKARADDNRKLHKYPEFIFGILLVIGAFLYFVAIGEGGLKFIPRTLACFLVILGSFSGLTTLTLTRRQDR